ncbi:MAG: protein kinase [Flavobacteriia bacterium]|nr:protein kinase [Flavobacteriia bacterium]
MNTFSPSDFKIIRSLTDEKNRKFNRVYLCEHIISGDKFVLKYIKKTDKNQKHLQKLLFEANLQFKHTSLPNFIGIYQNENELFCFKKFVEASPINIFFKKLKYSKTEFIRLFLNKIEPVFAEIQTMGLVHSDIKPSNILIEKNEKDFNVHLIDFGLSFYPNETNRELVYSLSYSAPELVLNLLDLACHKTDIYSLGICLFQLFEGEIPFKQSHPGMITHLQINSPLEFSYKTPKKWREIIQKMCVKQPLLAPPHQINIEKQKEIIQKGIEGRYNSIKEINKVIENIIPKDYGVKKWFFFRR